jgi:hypothetical protein
LDQLSTENARYRAVSKMATTSPPNTTIMDVFLFGATAGIALLRIQQQKARWDIILDDEQKLRAALENGTSRDAGEYVASCYLRFNPYQG